MSFSGRRAGRPLFTAPSDVADEDGWFSTLSGDAVVSVSPINFVGPVLGRLARALAARARFSLDRFSDVYLVTDAIAAHATRVATRRRLGFAIATAPRRLEIQVGPLQDGSGARLEGEHEVREPGSALNRLSDRVATESLDAGEVLSVVMTDGSSRVPAT
jgi:hypothetical protein